MIQRIQTLFLFFAAVALAIAAAMNTGTVLMLAVLIVSLVVSFGAIFLFKNRKRQALVVLVGMVLNLVWYVLLAVHNHQLDGAYLLVWSDAFPAVAIILEVLARKGIIKDEKLVRSLDRIR